MGAVGGGGGEWVWGGGGVVMRCCSVTLCGVRDKRLGGGLVGEEVGVGGVSERKATKLKRLVMIPESVIGHVGKVLRGSWRPSGTVFLSWLWCGWEGAWSYTVLQVRVHQTDAEQNPERQYGKKKREKGEREDYVETD